jgi:hypothetical protein
MGRNAAVRGKPVWLQAAALVLLGCSGDRALAQPAGSAANPPGNYSNIVTALFLQRAEQVSVALTLGGFIPAESFANATVALEGQSLNPSGQVRAIVCAYRFRDGVLDEITRSDLFEDKGPESLILRHLTNEVLTLTPQAAADRALDLLGRLSLDVAGLRRAYRIRVRDTLMDAYPIRNGGPNFPRDLHFYGELISRKKIRITVAFSPAEPKAVADCRFGGNMEIEFLATTGELLSVRFADPQALAQLGRGLVERIAVRDAPDFTPPIFVSAIRKLRGEVSVKESSMLLAEAWQELQQKLGTNQPRCYLVCDNLNAPEVIARQVTVLAGNTPWAGVSHRWRDDLPFGDAQINRPDRAQRGLGLLAVGGRIQIQLELMGGLGELVIPPDAVDSKEGRARRQELVLARVSDLMDRLRLPDAVPDHAVFLLGGKAHWSSGDIRDELQSRLRGKAPVFSPEAAASFSPVREGIAYFNGAVVTNAMVAMRISGFLPLTWDTLSLAHGRPARRLINSEIASPLGELASSFGPHPMQQLFDYLGPERIRLLQEGQRVEVFRIQEGNAPGNQSLLRGQTIEGREIIARGEPQGHDFAKALAAALLNEDSRLLGFLSLEDFPWSPSVAFRVWRGEASATLLVCFQSNVVWMKLPSGGGEQFHGAWLQFGKNRSVVARLARRAFPSDAALIDILRGRRGRVAPGVSP